MMKWMRKQYSEGKCDSAHTHLGVESASYQAAVPSSRKGT